MTEVIIVQRMWQRRGTAAEWAAQNPVLAAGEIGVELGATPAAPQRFKIGNGSTAWASLDWAGGGGSGGGAWYTGTAVPTPALGQDGDNYLRTGTIGTGDVYTKASGAWSIVGNIRGPQGDPGRQGDPGPQGERGEGSFATMGAQFSIQGDAVGARARVRVNCRADITGWTVLTDASGSAEVDVQVCPLPLYPAGLSSICGPNPPRLTTGTSAEGTVSGWTSTSLDRGDVVVFILRSATTVRDVTVVLDVIKRDPP